MQRKTVTTVRKKEPTFILKPAIKYTTRRKSTGNIRSSGRSLVVLATKYALNLYMSAALSLLSIALSWGNVKMAVNTGKNPQNTEMKNSNPACNAIWDFIITADTLSFFGVITARFPPEKSQNSCSCKNLSDP
ncbi:hypothetical protein ACJIZ3_021708 [Penstemon smallii]|uniref:Uncharacterized protein n=1 Tax=Penstemon smallii TaxID=265156 RepID=A0ABD3SM70_9LAMI